MMRVLITTVIFVCVASVGLACTSFLLEDGDDLYFVHSLNQGSMPSVGGAVYINPRGARKAGYSFGALFEPADDSPPELVWRSRFGSVTFSPLGKEMPDGGMNEAGLFIWEMSFDTEYPASDVVPTLFQMQWMQYQLDNFETVADVLANLDRVTLDGWGWHYFVADSKGAAAIIDFPDGRPEVFTGSSLPIPVCGNSYYPDAMRWLERHEDYGGELEYRREYHEIPRFVTGVKMVQEFDGEQPVPYCFETLQAMSVNVRWSVVFDVSRGEAWFNTNLDPELRRFAFTEADFAESAPPLRLDIDTPGPGDVRDRFQPFDRGDDERLVQQILPLFEFEATVIPDLARNMVQRLNAPPESDREALRGSWTGTLTAMGNGQENEFPLTLEFATGTNSSTGRVRCGAFEGDAAIRNLEHQGGQVRFAIDVAESGDRLEFQLYRTSEGMEGFSRSWNWDNRQKSKVTLSPSD
jgi:hypothetical protein